MPDTTTATEPTTNDAAPTTAKTPRTFTDYSVKAVLMRAELAITAHNADPEIRSAMADFNYDSAAMTQLDNQLKAARATVAATVQSRGAQQGKTKATDTAFTAARTATATFALICRELLDAPAQAALGLTGGRAPEALAAFLAYADTLFTNALAAPDDVKAILAKRGYTAERITAEKAKITALHTANQAQQQAKGTAQNLTPQQKEALSELDDAIMLYRKLARRALKTRPQLLEKLGIKAK